MKITNKDKNRASEVWDEIAAWASSGSGEETAGGLCCGGSAGEMKQAAVKELIGGCSEGEKAALRKVAAVNIAEGEGWTVEELQWLAEQLGGKLTVAIK